MMLSNRPLSLLTILGTGTCVPSLTRSACALAVQFQRSSILVDAGPGSMRRLLEAGMTIADIDFIFLSHFHPDHTAELVPFLFASKYPESRARKTPLTLVAASGLKAFFNGLVAAYGEWIELAPGMLRILELSNTTRDRRRFEDFFLESIPVSHRVESLAYRFSSPNRKTVVYSGDTDYSENLVALARNADLFICESSLPDALKAPGHLTPSLAGEIAAKAGVGRLVLTHFYPECDQVDVEMQCRRSYAGALTAARDLMTFDLNDTNE